MQESDASLSGYKPIFFLFWMVSNKYSVDFSMESTLTLSNIRLIRRGFDPWLDKLSLSFLFRTETLEIIRTFFCICAFTEALHFAFYTKSYLQYSFTNYMLKSSVSTLSPRFGYKTQVFTLVCSFRISWAILWLTVLFVFISWNIISVNYCVKRGWSFAWCSIKSLFCH